MWARKIRQNPARIITKSEDEMVEIGRDFERHVIVLLGTVSPFTYSIIFTDMKIMFVYYHFCNYI